MGFDFNEKNDRRVVEMKKEIFYSSVERVTYSFSLEEVITALCKDWGIKGGIIAGNDDLENTVFEITQTFNKKAENKNTLLRKKTEERLDDTGKT